MILFYLLLILGVFLIFYGLRSYIFRGKKMKNKNIGSGVILGVIFLILLIGCISTCVYTGIQNYNIGKDTNAWLGRAQVASKPSDMHLYLTNCREGMKKWGLTTGYDAIIFETPENDMSLIMIALDNSIDRANEISGLNIKSVEYQTALDDLRGQIRELDLHAIGRYWVIHWWYFLIVVSCIVLMCIVAAIYLNGNDG
jgi:hypothetical protein